MALQTLHPRVNAHFGAMSGDDGDGFDEDDEAAFDQILSLRDIVLAGKHPDLKLPQAAIDLLKRSRTTADNFAAVSANSQLHQYSSPNARGFDPLVLQKSEYLVRAEGGSKRQRIERELQLPDENDRDNGGETPMYGEQHLDVDAILLDAWQRVPPVSGLKPAEKDADSSFDENDYYSSQVQRNPLHVGNAQIAHQAAASAYIPRTLPQDEAGNSNWQPQSFDIGNGGSEDDGDDDEDDDEYDPPDADAFDGMQEPSTMLDPQHDNEADDEDDSEYEPGDITQDSTNATPHHQSQQQQQAVPIIRNHLTHLAAPQPNRVSSLTTVKGGGAMELELVNGRPEVRKRAAPASRASTVSPPQGQPPLSKKARKRKREHENQAQKKGKKRKSLPEARVKAEQVSPQYAPLPNFTQPAAHPQQYPPQSALRYEYAQPSTPTRTSYLSARNDAPESRRRRARDASPDYTPPVAPYHPDASRYAREEYHPAHEYMRQPSPPRPQSYSMPPPPQRIVVDQYGNRYVAADPVPPIPIIATPVERPAVQNTRHDPAPSRAGTVYAAPQYEYADRMPPPPMPVRQEYLPEREQRIEYVNHGVPAQRYDMMPPPAREPTSPAFAPPQRAYSVRPEEQVALSGYARQPSVAPTQYYRPDPPPRAVTAVPGPEAGYSQMVYSNYAQPQPVKYVDQYGNPVHFG